MKQKITDNDFHSALDEIHNATAQWELPFGPACDSIELAYRKKLAVHIGNTAGIAFLSSQGQEEYECVSLLEKCSDNIIKSLLDTPSIAANCYWERDIKTPIMSAKFLKNAILLLEKDKLVKGWTPLGDAFLNYGVVEYTAPRIENIVIDTVSPARLEGAGAGKWIDLSAEPTEIRLEAINLISQAIELLDKHCINAGEFVRRELRVIVPRSSTDSGSSSTISYPGRAVLDFPARSLTVGEVAEALVHESLHTLLYKCEALYHWIDDEPGWSRKVISPWSGNELSLHAYSHAFFVWYALAGLWLRLYGVDESILGVDPKFRMWTAVKGFLNNALSSIEQDTALSSLVKQRCAALQKDIIGWYG